MIMTRDAANEAVAHIRTIRNGSIPLPLNLTCTVLSAAKAADPDFRISTKAWIAMRKAIVDDHQLRATAACRI